MSAAIMAVAAALFSSLALPVSAQPGATGIGAHAAGPPESTDKLFRSALDALEPDAARFRAIKHQEQSTQAICLPDAALLSPAPNEPLFRKPRTLERDGTTWTCSEPLHPTTSVPKNEASPILPLTPNATRPSQSTEPRQPHYDSTNPQDTEQDWEFEEFCAWLGAKYDWTLHACIEPKPPT